MAQQQTTLLQTWMYFASAYAYVALHMTVQWESISWQYFRSADATQEEVCVCATRRLDWFHPRRVCALCVCFVDVNDSFKPLTVSGFNPPSKLMLYLHVKIAWDDRRDDGRVPAHHAVYGLQHAWLVEDWSNDLFGTIIATNCFHSLIIFLFVQTIFARVYCVYPF